MHDILSERINSSLKMIQNLDFSKLTAGKYIVNDDFFYIVQEYETKSSEEGRHEGHKQYVDIQYMVQGAEYIEVTSAAFMTVDEPYDEERDVVFFKEPKRANKVLLTEGKCEIFYPRDSHKPGISVEKPTMIKKIIGKVRIPQ